LTCFDSFVALSFPPVPKVSVFYVNNTLDDVTGSVSSLPFTLCPNPHFVVPLDPRTYYDIPDLPHRAEQYDSAPVASSVPAVTASDRNVGAGSWLPSDKLSDTDPLGKTTSATTLRGSEISAGSEWASFLKTVKASWMGYTIGPFRGYLGIIGILDTTLDHAALANEADPGVKSFEQQLEDERIRLEEEAESRRRYEERVRREQRRVLRREERLRHRPKLLADRLAAQASHEVAVRMHVKINWNHYQSRLNGKVRRSFAASYASADLSTPPP
jgi:hypothetical protein